MSVAGLALALCVWQAIFIGARTPFVPGPWQVVAYLADNLFQSSFLEQQGLSDGGGLLPALVYTTRNVLLGVTTGCILGIVLGLLSLRVPVIAAVSNPIAAIFGTAPVVVAAPFFLIWFGIIPATQFLILAFYTSLLLFVYSRRAGFNVPPAYVESALTLGSSPWSTFRYIYVPGATPEIVAALRIAFASSWGLEAIAEFLGSQDGVGLLLRYYGTLFEADAIIGLMVTLGFLALVVDTAILGASRILLRWSEAGHQLQL